jgi:hypothetical protein
MSATGKTPFFDNDGTNAPAPQAAFADPLSGTVTPSNDDQSVAEEFERLRIADPVQPDPAARDLVNAVRLAENADYDRPLQSSAEAPQVNGLKFVAGQPPLGVIPQQRTWPVRAPQLLRQARRPKQRRAGDEDVEEVRRVRPKRVRRRIRPSKPSSNSAGVIIAIVLMIVFAVVAIQLLASLFSSIASIFA